MIDFICSSNNQQVLDNNLKRSSAFDVFPLVVKEDFTNIPKAYNSHKSMHPYVCYVHNDVFLPNTFLYNLGVWLERLPPDFGVIGVAGCKLENGIKANYGNISDRGRAWKYGALPQEVQTIDELLFITHGDIVFDENLPLDFYAADACMQMIAAGRKNYVIDAYVEHNSSRAIGGRTEAFYKAESYFRKKWGDAGMLPVVTTCSLIL